MKYSDLLGIKYKPHGRNLEEGFDCYGLVIEVLARNGIKVPDLYYDSLKPDEEFVCQFNSHTTEIEKPEENCLIEIATFDSVGHVAVYIGDGLMIHTMIRTGVVIEPVRHYSHKIKGYYRVNN